MAASDIVKKLWALCDILRDSGVNYSDYLNELVMLMITDVLLSGSHLLYLGDVDAVRQAFNVDIRDDACFLPKVISRKKQIVPMLSALWG